MDADKLLELIADDDLGLLAVKPKQAPGLSEDERLAESFFEIVDFYRENGRAPENDSTNMQEARLAMRLSGLRTAPDKVKALLDLDEFGLLAPVKSVESVDDIFGDDELNLLGDGGDDSIFQLRHVPESIDTPDYVAQRQPCAEFDQYESLFLQCQEDLRCGKRSLYPFANEQQIAPGQFFILRGVMAYIADVGKKEKKRGKVNARLHCIFENGTESDMLLRSLACELYKDGRRISEHEDHLLDGFKPVTDEDTQTGWIYVLKSLSTNPDIAAIQDLYKIGFTTTPVEERIRNAEDDPTYLMAKVRVVEVFDCYNLNPQKLELLLHKFFGKVCLDLDVFDKANRRHTPREWFIAPLAVIEETINLIISGDIVKFAYNPETRMISPKEKSL